MGKTGSKSSRRANQKSKPSAKVVKSAKVQTNVSDFEKGKIRIEIPSLSARSEATSINKTDIYTSEERRDEIVKTTQIEPKRK